MQTPASSQNEPLTPSKRAPVAACGSGLMPRFTVVEVAAIESRPSKATRRPRLPPRMAIRAAIPSQRRE